MKHNGLLIVNAAQFGMEAFFLCLLAQVDCCDWKMFDVNKQQ